MPKPVTYLLLLVLLLVPLSAPTPAAAQDQGLALPADLFLLNDDAQIMHIAPGTTFAEDVTQNQVVLDFGVAPDGQWLAYRSAEAPDGSNAAVVAITDAASGSGSVLAFDPGEPPITGQGPTLTWSPDGLVVAYTTQTGLMAHFLAVSLDSARTDQAIAGGPFSSLSWSPGGSYLAAGLPGDEGSATAWTIYRRDGMSLAQAGQIPASAGLAWVREGVLALAPPEGSLLTLDLRSNTQTALLDASVIVSQPTLISGDRLIFFEHESTQRFAARRFGIVSTLGGDYESFEAALELNPTMRWLPDGSALLALNAGALTLIEPRTNSRRDLYDSVQAYAWGPLAPTEVSGLALPEPLYFLSRDEADVAQIWRLPADGRAVEQITQAARNVLDFALSPDGSQLAYSSGGRLLLASSDGADPRELSGLGERAGAGGQPAWRPDGQVIAFARDGIWLVPVSGGARTELVTDSLGEGVPPDQVRVHLNPRWDPTGTRLLVSLGYYEGMGLGVLPITGGAATPLPVATTQGEWLPNGLILTWEASLVYTTPGMYLVDPAQLDTYTTILDDTWHILAAQPLANEAAVVLSSPGGDMLGPSTFQPYLVPLLAEAQPFAHGQGGLVEGPVLASGGQYAAGLRQARYGDFGLAGRLVILHLENGEQTAINTPGEVWGLEWGG